MTLSTRPTEVLLVEDHAADARRTPGVLRKGKVRNDLRVTTDGVDRLGGPPSDDCWLTSVELPEGARA